MFRAGKENSNADGLSRLPLRESPSSVPVPGDTVLMMEALLDMGSAVSAATIKSWTDRDPVLSRVRRMVLHGWQPQEGVDFQPYEQRKHELSVEDGCVLGAHGWWYHLLVERLWLGCCMKGILGSPG